MSQYLSGVWKGQEESVDAGADLDNNAADDDIKVDNDIDGDDIDDNSVLLLLLLYLLVLALLLLFKGSKVQILVTSYAQDMDSTVSVYLVHLHSRPKSPNHNLDSRRLVVSP